MKPLITFILISLSISTYGQNALDDLIGTWKYQDLYEKEKIDSAGAKMLAMVFGSMTLQFDDTNLYRASVMGRDEEGKWMYEGDESIKLISDKGNVSEVQIIELNKDQLILEMQKKKLIMTKLQESEGDRIIAKEEVLETVKITKAQLARKWYLKSRDSSKNLSDNVSASVSQLLKGSYMNFSSNGKFEAEILNIKEKGKWEFGEGNEIMVTMKNGQGKIWNVIRISEKQLILVPGKSAEKWIFGISE